MRSVKSLSWFMAFGLLSTTAAFAQSDVTNLYTHLTQKNFAAPAGTCSLKRATFLDYHQAMKAGEQFVGGRYTAHSTAVVLETSDPSCLKQYAVVQYVKGCVYHLAIDKKTQKKERYFEIARQLRDETAPTAFLDWTVDSTLISPMKVNVNQDEFYADRGVEDYRVPNRAFDLSTSHPEESMKNAYQTLFTASNPKNQLSTSLRQNPTPMINQMFVSSLSEGSTYYPQGFKKGTRDFSIPSLQYMSCIYHAQDVPATGDPARFDAPEAKGGPIYCFSWNDNLVFNLSTGAFKTGTKIDPYCTSADAKEAIQKYKDDAKKESIWNFPANGNFDH
jgi:hypothetical protein